MVDIIVIREKWKYGDTQNEIENIYKYLWI